MVWNFFKTAGDVITALTGGKKDPQRESQKKAWTDAWVAHPPNVGSSSDPIGKAVTDNAKKMYEVNSSESDGYSEDGGGGSSDGGSSDGGISPEEAQKQAEEKARQKAQKKALASISKMKDSNVSYQYKTDYNDPWNAVAVNEQNDIWSLKEKVFLYTFHDKQRHEYLTSITIDSDKNDIMTTAQASFPYKHELMEYWIPGKTTFAIVGGTFDRETLFIGRVSEINQRGEEIEMVGQNIGWKFKAYTSQDFEEVIQGMSVKNVVKLAFKKLGFDKGKYHIDIDDIPNIDEYKVGEGGEIEKNGEQIQNIPELTDVVKNLQEYNMDKVIKQRSKTREIQKAAKDYDKTVKMTTLDGVTNSSQHYNPSLLRQNYGIATKVEDKELIYEPILKKIQGKQKLEDYLIKGYSGEGENTYEDILLRIASAIDAQFFIVDTTVCFMSFNALLTNSFVIQKAITPKIDYWQLEEDSYELNANQYGFYNTVEIKYKNGTVTRDYEDLVKIFGVIKVKYDEPKLDYEGAMLKAQAYLSAHIRDFGMELKATVLHTGKLYPCNFVKLKNPLTMSEGLFFIQGVSVQWSADNQTLVSDLDLRFGPENPDELEVPEVGTSYGGSGDASQSSYGGSKASSNVSANIKQAALEITKGCRTEEDKAYAIYDWVDRNVKYEFYYNSKYSSSEVLQKKIGNCYDQAYLIYRLCDAVNVRCEVHNGTFQFLDGTYGHLWNKLPYKGQMTFADTGYGSTGSLVRNPIGSMHGGKILSDSLAEKNY